MVKLINTSELTEMNNTDKIDLLANLSQFVSLFLLLKDASNNELMQELQNQNKNYLSKIIEQNEKIMEKLGIEDDNI